ncbi:4-hydroxythreonine-4-phosphate dehydrogenase PdxA [Pelagibacterium lacus]|uniref:4-hydroxythreonine-4-phosphate dehydrogenase n=1 Tax=Pelagibacterium lacus TaxID=2282655 RepID=A0A369W7P6_9HYPH|nr:4-hydroxythreonine-4-phosphate dehydrogenase PdxA [Pelagibacterium lacus]RDE09865.1 4-hydroxythreonine-4-phosphate dehydrogenase PdxA [Pelagibacterium lacus]
MRKGPALPLAISMGEPAGVGPDLILQLYADRQSLGLPVFGVFGHAGFLAQRARRLGLDIRIEPVTAEEVVSAFDTALPVIAIDGDVEDTPGTPDPNAAPVVVGAIARAVEAIEDGAFRGLVTAPIHKAVLYGAGFEYPGHTEFLAALCDAPLPVMMLAHEDLRTVPLTIHIPLADVPRAITRDLICDTVRIVARDLATRFRVASPRIAIAGLNPHAGEDGTIGREEVETIAPALDRLRAEGLDIVGPLSADTLFYPPYWRKYDCIIAMFHDQALIPIKTIAFDSGVNVTLGLPIVRTSPDHGTAFSLAGTGTASPNSLLAAIRMADAIA